MNTIRQILTPISSQYRTHQKIIITFEASVGNDEQHYQFIIIEQDQSFTVELWALNDFSRDQKFIETFDFEQEAIDEIKDLIKQYNLK